MRVTITDLATGKVLIDGPATVDAAMAQCMEADQRGGHSHDLRVQLFNSDGSQFADFVARPGVVTP